MVSEKIVIPSFGDSILEIHISIILDGISFTPNNLFENSALSIVMYFFGRNRVTSEYSRSFRAYSSALNRPSLSKVFLHENSNKIIRTEIGFIYGEGLSYDYVSNVFTHIMLRISVFGVAKNGIEILLNFPGRYQGMNES